ncbi:YSIRK-type signal peptide-containing protein [Streptococcus mutans]
MTFEKQKHFSLRKLKFGLVSVCDHSFLICCNKDCRS